jgi:hypothetical protein
MIEWRKPRLRRMVDKKWYKIIIALLWFLIAISAMYMAYLAGGEEARKVYKEQLSIYEKNNVASKMEFYGKNYYYFQHKGVHYFVKQAKDLDDEKKWIKVK